MTPCQDPANDPEDWFIEPYGTQYRDEPLVTFEEAEAELERHDDESEATVAEVFTEMEAERLKVALRRRRHAKDKCYTECAARAACLALALGDNPATEGVTIDHGTFGGYYPEERKAIITARNARRSRSA